MTQGQQVLDTHVSSVVKGSPAAEVFRPGDRILSVNGVGGSASALRNKIVADRCSGTAGNDCLGAQPLHIVIRRNGQVMTVTARPRYVASGKRMELGFEFGTRSAPISAGAAVSGSGKYLWGVTRSTVSTVARIFQPQERKQLSGVVGGYTVTQESFATSTTRALEVLALISLSLGVINLFPFLPLDGGHVFWALAEKVRGKRIPFSVMERAGIIGFALIILLFVIGLSNDISTLTGPGFNISR
jgi:regulator of sigma E protease